MLEELEEIRKRHLEMIKAAADPESLNEERVSALGKKGDLTSLLKTLKNIAPADRPAAGQRINAVRREIEQALAEATSRMEAKQQEIRLSQETIDVTLPAKRIRYGHSHPNTKALREMEKIFIGMGYEVVEGPEIEKDYYNFEAFPPIIRPRMNRTPSILTARCFSARRPPARRFMRWKREKSRSA